MKDQVEGEFGPYRQSERKHLYKQYESFNRKRACYFAFDSAEELEQMREMSSKAKCPIGNKLHYSKFHEKFHYLSEESN